MKVGSQKGGSWLRGLAFDENASCGHLFIVGERVDTVMRLRGVSSQRDMSSIYW